MTTLAKRLDVKLWIHLHVRRRNNKERNNRKEKYYNDKNEKGHEVTDLE
jgi:hypothetical protein